MHKGQNYFKEDLTILMLILSEAIKELSKYLASHNHNNDSFVDSVYLRTKIA